MVVWLILLSLLLAPPVFADAPVGICIYVRDADNAPITVPELYSLADGSPAHSTPGSAACFPLEGTTTASVGATWSANYTLVSASYTDGGALITTTTSAEVTWPVWNLNDPTHTLTLVVANPLREPEPTPGNYQLPPEGIQPYDISFDGPSPLDGVDLAPLLVPMARIALTLYTVMSYAVQGENVWVFFGIILIIPVAGMIVYRLMLNPPEI